MKRLFSEINIDSEDEMIIEQCNKRRRLNTITKTNNLFQNKFQVSFDLKPILSEYLDIDIQKEVYCIYCNRLYLPIDCITCKKCDKKVCNNCEMSWWHKVIDFRNDSIIDCCPTCIKDYKYCNICKNHYKTNNHTYDNKKCKKCKKYICKICMPNRIEKININEHDVHVGGGAYNKYNHAYSSNKMYCTTCFMENLSGLKNLYFRIVAL